MQNRSVQPGFTFEYFMWIFTRLSGIGMIVLAALGMAGAFIMGARTQMDLATLMRWTFFPNPNHVVNSNIPDVTLGWANAFWQIMQYLIIFFAFTHAANGIRMIAEDYVGHTIWQPFVRALIALLWIGMVIVGIYVVLGSAY